MASHEVLGGPGRQASSCSCRLHVVFMPYCPRPARLLPYRVQQTCVVATVMCKLQAVLAVGLLPCRGRLAVDWCLPLCSLALYTWVLSQPMFCDVDNITASKGRYARHGNWQFAWDEQPQRTPIYSPASILQL